MSYHVVEPADLDPTLEYPCDRRSIAEETGLSTLAAAVYEVAPGEELAQEYHYHHQREELFYVLAGTLHVETPEGAYEVPAESVFVVTPDSPIRPYNPDNAEESVRVFGVGAPQYDIGRSYTGGRNV
jgi:mannose-6-phosphate isomerase-like protein (cupin superfamily)